LAVVRKNKELDWLGPDGKSQVTVEYKNDIPVAVKKVVIATQHHDLLEQYITEEEEFKIVNEGVANHVIKPVLDKYGIKYVEDFIVNGTGRFVKGGPEADTGLTGRKIIVDTYGGYAPHGGGAFSGKDPSKVDRSATYMARYIAKNIVAADLADRCEIQLSYSIGVPEPTSVWVRTFGTGKIADNDLTRIVQKLFPLKPAEIINHLQLKHPRYFPTAAYGHFGREEELFTWEKRDMVEKLKSNVD
jgi:S-adenosylmethionine synthetase